jgi:hypothetical protein
MVGPAAHGQVNGFNDSEKGGDQKAALQSLSSLTRGHHHPMAVRRRLENPAGGFLPEIISSAECEGLYIAVCSHRN